MNKSFICLVPCKPYDDLGIVIEGIKVLKKKEEHSLFIEPYLALADFDQISEEEKKRSPEIQFGTSAMTNNSIAHFTQSVECQILKDKKAQFVFIGERNSNGSKEGTDSALEQKIKTSIRAGLPVLLGVQVHEDVESLRKQLQSYLSALSEEDRTKIMIVYQTDPSQRKRLEGREICRSLENCRRILEEIGGRSFAEHIKILFSIPKYNPEILKSCLKGQIDGVCIYPVVLPKKIETADNNIEISSVNTLSTHPEEEKEEEVECVFPLEREVINHSHDFSKRKRKGTCLIYCHPYDEIESVLEGVKQLAGQPGEIEYLCALPFSSIAHVTSYPEVVCGVWGISFANTNHLTHSVHFEMLKESRSAFIFLGDHLNQMGLKSSGILVNQQIEHALSMGLAPLIGVTCLRDFKSQLEKVFQNIEKESLKKAAIVFYGGLYGESIEREEEEIEKQIQVLRCIIKELYDEETAHAIKIYLEVSPYSGDPLVYLAHSSVDGISLSSTVLAKERMLSMIKSRASEPVVDEEYFEEKEEEKIVNNVTESTECDFLVQEEPLLLIEQTLRGKSAKSNHPREHIPVSKEEENSLISPVAATASEGLQRIKLTVDECAERLAESYFQETYLPSDQDFESPELKLERMKVEYKTIFKEFSNHSVEGWRVLFEEMKENHEAEREAIIRALDPSQEKIMSFTNIEAINAAWNHDHGKLWYEVIGLSKNQMATLYQTAKSVFKKKKYKEAADAFFTLVSLNAREYRGWFGYGMAKKLEGVDLEAALDAFSIANSFKPGMPEPYIHAAECYLELGNIPEAERCLKHGKQLLEGYEDCVDLKLWAEQLTKQIR